MLGILGRLLPWIIILAVWFALNRALDKVDAQKARSQAGKFWKSTWLTYMRYIVTGIFLFFIIRWLAALISTPVP